MRIFDRETYLKVNILVNEIYQNARNNNLDFFWSFVERSLIESNEHFNIIGRQIHGDEFVDMVITDDEIKSAIQGLTSQFIDARIYRTYRRMTGRVNNKIILNYIGYRPERGLSFRIVLLLNEDGNVELYNLMGFR